MRRRAGWLMRGWFWLEELTTHLNSPLCASLSTLAITRLPSCMLIPGRLSTLSLSRVHSNVTSFSSTEHGRITVAPWMTSWPMGSAWKLRASSCVRLTAKAARRRLYYIWQRINTQKKTVWIIREYQKQYPSGFNNYLWEEILYCIPLKNYTRRSIPYVMYHIMKL